MEQVPSRLSHVGLTGAIPMMSGSVSFMARSTPKMQLSVLALSTSSRQGVHSEPSGLDRALARCTFAGTSLTRKSVSSALSVFCAFSASWRGTGPCNQEWMRRYAPLDGASRTEGRLYLRQGGFPRRERPWAAVIDKRPAAEASCPPAAQAKKQSTWSIYNLQASARKQKSIEKARGTGKIRAPLCDVNSII